MVELVLERKKSEKTQKSYFVLKRASELGDVVITYKPTEIKNILNVTDDQILDALPQDDTFVSCGFVGIKKVK